MKRTILTIGFVLVLLTLSAPFAYCQTANVEVKVPSTTSISGTVQLTIPFQFSVNGKSFSMGQYYFAPTATNEKAITIRSLDGKQAIVVLTNGIFSARAVDHPKLVFHKYGDQYFLVQTWLRASDIGRELFVSPQEIEVARTLRQQQVTLVAAQ